MYFLAHLSEAMNSRRPGTMMTRLACRTAYLDEDRTCRTETRSIVESRAARQNARTKSTHQELLEKMRNYRSNFRSQIWRLSIFFKYKEMIRNIPQKCKFINPSFRATKMRTLKRLPSLSIMGHLDQDDSPIYET